MKIKMKQDWQFSENGYTMTDFEEGKVYDVSESCCDSALQENVAVQVGGDSETTAEKKERLAAEAKKQLRIEEAEEKAKLEAEERARQEAEANKAKGNAPENK